MNFIAASPQKCESTEMVFCAFFVVSDAYRRRILRSVFTVMKGGGAYENYPFYIFHSFLHIKQIYKPPPPLRIRHAHTEKRRA